MALELELKKLGFSDKEARVYLALLELGSAAVQDIAAKAKVNRATTYVVLDKLSKDGIVSTVEHGKKTHFAAESPAALLRIFKTKEREMRDKEDEFKKALPEFEALYNLSGEKPKVRFFEGPEGLRAAREDILESGAKILYDIYSLEYVNQVRALFSTTENDEFRRRQQERGITIRSIYTSDTGPFGGFKLKGERRFVPKDKFPFSSDILIYGDRVASTTLRGKIISVIVESKEIADTMRFVFELAWLGADHV
ncbi:MAG: hypothetical protein A3H71_00060 [Candidatus Sungbacteria bacterium RIFCSPLOWO2_02_FULL_48_13b]|uniref:Transcription regulator TrmB N-terminal domain-containing protein n=2 Tax=Candidatus Sungiibacteriota TaxID=1817917 RepID=A0A1G2LF07_9BACT|nr:MAG: hypothetical protein A3C12_00420 [Candidatus Sungbacteria bacterium RIFCSPHIGHO2_02_FULL_49_20]OHA10233.1 MAG: hypothetical protein A3H71_00060 [Candidatus Sungbacteria bacterium RIFCSPLOWO2_02_FULL_48_13b]